MSLRHSRNQSGFDESVRSMRWSDLPHSSTALYPTRPSQIRRTSSLTTIDPSDTASQTRMSTTSTVLDVKKIRASTERLKMSESVYQACKYMKGVSFEMDFPEDPNVDPVPTNLPPEARARKVSGNSIIEQFAPPPVISKFTVRNRFRKGLTATSSLVNNRLNGF